MVFMEDPKGVRYDVKPKEVPEKLDDGWKLLETPKRGKVKDWLFAESFFGDLAMNLKDVQEGIHKFLNRHGNILEKSDFREIENLQKKLDSSRYKAIDVERKFRERHWQRQ